MKFRIHSVTLAAALLGGALLAGVMLPHSAGAAPPRPPHASAPPSHPATLEQAVKEVQRETGGHILAADTVSRGRTQVYRIKVLKPGGKVQVVQLHSDPKASGHADKSDRGGE